MEPREDSSPMWLQRSTSTVLLLQRRRRSPPPFFRPVLLILMLPILALLIIFFLVPPFFSHTAQILRPAYSLEKCWDSLSILLVVLAILCGVFAKRHDDASAAETSDERNSSSVSSFSFSGRPGQPVQGNKGYNAVVGLPETAVNRLITSSRSYPDLRQLPRSETGENPFPFCVDFEVNLCRTPPTSPPSRDHIHLRPRRTSEAREQSDIKVIPVGTYEVLSSRASFQPPPPPPPKSPTPASPGNLKRRRSLHSVSRKEKMEKPSVQAQVIESQLDQSQSPSGPPQPVEFRQLSESTQECLQRKKSGTAKEITTAIALLYNQRKRKRKLKKKSNQESSSDSSPPSMHSNIPPKKPLPPPSKVLQNLFKKSITNKHVQFVSAIAPPPPPPPNSIFNNLFKAGNKSKSFISSSSSGPPPPSPPPPLSSIINAWVKKGSKSRRFKPESSSRPPPAPPPPTKQVSSKGKSKYTQSPFPTPPREPQWRRATTAGKPPPLPTKKGSDCDENFDSGGQSKLITIPRPPPPPFKMPEFKFVASEDFLTRRRAHKSLCCSPDLENGDGMSVKSPEPLDGADSIEPSVFCASPDVNLKADSFIARLKGQWRLEKMRSMREKHKLGRDPGLKLD